MEESTDMYKMLEKKIEEEKANLRNTTELIEEVKKNIKELKWIKFAEYITQKINKNHFKIRLLEEENKLLSKLF